jgi:MFS transporter, DHA3 family, macrolide efflux protein
MSQSGNTAIAIDPSSRWQPRFWTIWIGQALSLLGSALTQFVLIWWITSTTGSVTALATAGIAALLPQALLGPLGGVIADRLPRRLIMIVADSITAACMIVLVVLFSTDRIQLWHVYTLMFVRSSMQAFQSPASASSTANLVPTSWLPRVAGLNQSLGGVVTIAAAPLGALALAVLPLQTALMIDVVTAVLGILPLLMHRIPQPKETQNKTSSVLADLQEGVRFVARDPGLLPLYAVLGWVVLTIMPAYSLLPLLVKQAFSGGPGDVALVQGVSGFGLIVGGLIAAVLPRKPVVNMMLAYAVSGGAVALVTLLPDTGLWIAVGLWTLSGMGFSVGNANMFALLQSAVPNHMQGRAFSLLSTLIGLAGPVGLVFAQPIGDAVGIGALFWWGGVLDVIVCLFALTLPALRQLEARQPVTSSDATRDPSRA